MLRQQRQHHSGCQSVVLVEERGGLARGRLGSRQGFPLSPCPSGWLTSGCIGSSERFLQGGTLCPQRVPEGVVLHGTLESSQEVMLSQALPSPQPRQISLETSPWLPEDAPPPSLLERPLSFLSPTCPVLRSPCLVQEAKVLNLICFPLLLANIKSEERKGWRSAKSSPDPGSTTRMGRSSIRTSICSVPRLTGSATQVVSRLDHPFGQLKEGTKRPACEVGRASSLPLSAPPATARNFLTTLSRCW